KCLPIAAGDRYLADQRSIGDADGLGCRLVLDGDVAVVLRQDESTRFLHDCTLGAMQRFERQVILHGPLFDASRSCVNVAAVRVRSCVHGMRPARVGPWWLAGFGWVIHNGRRDSPTSYRPGCTAAFSATALAVVCSSSS